MMIIHQLVLIALAFATACNAFLTFGEKPLRKLIAGSNCIYIERGLIPPYYKCLGCQFEEAAACVHDIRHNLSWNVDGGCPMLKLSETPTTQCCPRLFFDRTQNRHELQYGTAAYPMALECMRRVGCGEELIYRELENECLSLCTELDVRLPTLGQSMCYAPFNAAPSEWFNSRSAPLGTSSLSYLWGAALRALVHNAWLLTIVVLVALSVVNT